jgi:hypothetical protein
MAHAVVGDIMYSIDNVDSGSSAPAKGGAVKRLVLVATINNNVCWRGRLSNRRFNAWNVAVIPDDICPYISSNICRARRVYAGVIVHMGHRVRCGRRCATKAKKESLAKLAKAEKQTKAAKTQRW